MISHGVLWVLALTLVLLAANLLSPSASQPHRLRRLSNGSSVSPFSWYLGEWGSCSGPCGTLQFRTRKVDCIQTCSVPLACPRLEHSKCSSLNTSAHATEDCGVIAPACATTTTYTTSTSTVSVATTSTIAASSGADTTSVAAGGVDGGGDSGGGGGGVVLPGDSENWECLVILGQKASQSDCATGANVDSLCGVGCPCCRRKAASGGSVGGSVVSTPTGETGEGLSNEVAIGLVAGAILVICVILACAYALLRRKGSRYVQNATDSAAQDSPHVKVYGKDAWGEAFERPPGIDIHLRGEDDDRRGNEDDSTDDSEHGGDGLRRARTAPVVGAAEAPRSKEAKRSKSTKNTAHDQEGSPMRKSQTAYDQEDSPMRKSHGGRSQERPKSAAQVAAEVAFTEGLGAGKERPSKKDRKEQQRKRGTSSSGSAHPKGTAVPPRARDTEQDGAPGPGKSEGAPPSSSSAHSATTGDQGAPLDSNTAEAKADVGAATPVNEHVQKLDAELDATRTQDVEVRRKTFKTLLLKWHPDKNTGGMGEAESAAQANEVFKHLLDRRDRYLAD